MLKLYRRERVHFVTLNKIRVHLIMCISGHIPPTKSELDKSVDLSLCGLAPAQSKMDLSFKTHFARETNKGPPILTNQKKPFHA